MPSKLSVLFVGDIVGKPGRNCLARGLRKFPADIVIVNGENAAGGFGLTIPVFTKMLEQGVDVVTSGNHIWNKRDIYPVFDDAAAPLLRPANFSPFARGRGWYLLSKDGMPPVAVINLAGRAFMDCCDCPLRTADRILEELAGQAQIIIVDFHAEATAEKGVLINYLDGRVSAVIGTHTHVQTADERVTANGTAFITDAGMTGPREGVIGIRGEQALERMLTGMPNRFEVAGGPLQFNAVRITIMETGKAVAIERIREEYAELGG